MRRWLPIAMVLLVTMPTPLWAWGSRGHHIVNSGAIDIVPPPLHDFFDRQRGEMVVHAIDPDVWAEHHVMTPPYTHFIDLEYYGSPPFADVPRDYDAAVAKYGADKPAKWGTLPWEIAKRQAALTEAFRDGRWDDVIREATWLGHYIADSTMPLHATKDYQGKEFGCVVLPGRSENRTAHQRIESELINHHARDYDSVRGLAADVQPIPLEEECWTNVKTGHALVPEVLKADLEASKLEPTFGRAFYADMEKSIGPVIKRRLAQAQVTLASAWLTAWEDAGRPALPTREVRVSWPTVSAPTPREAHHVAGAPVLAGALPIIAALLVFILRAGRRRP